MTTNLKNFGNRVREIRKSLGISQEELANQIGYKTKGSIARIENGSRDLPIDKLKLIAKVLNTTPEYLVDWEIKPLPKSNIIPLDNQIISIPVFSSISAGLGAVIDTSYMDDEDLDYIHISDFPSAKSCFAVKVSGDSMEPTIPNNSIVIINQEFFIDNNQIGAFSVNDEHFLKRKKIINNTILLESINRDYEPIIISETDNFKEIGKVVRVIIDFSNS